MSKARDAHILEIVIPAAFSPRESGEGIQCLLNESRVDPRFRGDDANLQDP